MLRLFFISSFLFVTLWAGRCHNLVREVRVSHYAVFGVDYPYWYGVGQLQQESNCRNAISKDGVGSQGVSQITYRIWKRWLKKKGITDIKSVRNQIRAQAWIMKDAKKQAYSSHLWVAYQIYNGGSLVNKEIKRARKAYGIREVSHAVAREFCRRRIITFNSGQQLDACDINYEYSHKVFEYGKKYKLFNSNYIYW